MNPSETIDLAQVDRSVFQPLLDSECILRGETESFPVRLIEISELPDNRPADERIRKNPFALVFLCESAVLIQGMYGLEHPKLPPCNLFLSPFEGGDGWCKLEALFN